MCAALSSFLLLRFENGKGTTTWVSHGWVQTIHVYRGSDNGSPNPNAAEYARVWAYGGVSGRRNSAVRVFKHVSV